ncbi:MAG TPA: hypothetical protein VHY20_11345 [Pirellulales bacterium]|nr:hypothetical protein [Pirellulales bacterium]
MRRGDGPLEGPDVESLTVGSWCPTPDGSGEPEAVAISIRIKCGHDVVWRLRSAPAVDEVIQMLLRHKREVWPDAH